MTSGRKGDKQMPVELEPVPPSWLVRKVMRPLTQFLNPLSLRMAGGPGFRMAGRIHHVGRRSGSEYVTPVGARLKHGEILIPLTFGNRSDWVRNVRVAGGAIVEVRGHSYQIGAPEFLNWTEGRPVVRDYFPVARGVFKTLGIKQFMHAPVVDSPSSP
jgi:deazaflavin-dependent oxidoreductase (nitroreductase family)